jgi:DNA-binding GntR family transcriptional regulator
MKARRAGHDIAGYLDANIAFHNAILLHTDNEPLRRSLEVANEIAQPLRYRVLTQSLGDSPSIAEHERIIELIAANNLPEAAAMMEYHIMNGLDASLRAAAILGIGEEEQA